MHIIAILYWRFLCSDCFYVFFLRIWNTDKHTGLPWEYNYHYPHTHNTHPSPTHRTPPRVQLSLSPYTQHTPFSSIPSHEETMERYKKGNYSDSIDLTLKWSINGTPTFNTGQFMFMSPIGVTTLPCTCTYIWAPMLFLLWSSGKLIPTFNRLVCTFFTPNQSIIHKLIWAS